MRSIDGRNTAQRIRARRPGIRAWQADWLVWRRRWLEYGLIFLLGYQLLLWAPSAEGGWLRPVEGGGNFQSTADVLTLWRDDGTLDVVLIIAVANREVTFKEEDGHWVGELKVEAELAGYDGEVVHGQKTIRLQAIDELEAAAPALYQVFPLIMRGVTSESGRLMCRLEDRNRNRLGLLNAIKNRKARSEIVSDWSAPPRAETTDGLHLADPVFLTNAPIKLWRSEDPLADNFTDSTLIPYLHPGRRYGLEQDRLQLYFEVEPPRNGSVRQMSSLGIFVQVLAKDLGFAFRDTIAFDERRLRSLDQGRTTGVYYELDVNNLPPGAYQLSCGPANGQGRGWLAEFDVVWSLSSLHRHGDEVRGEGCTVFFGDDLNRFLDVGQTEREVMLEEFWSAHDPDSDTPFNEAYLEFRQRLAYVRQHLGGFNRSGAVDDRGQLFLLMGAPDEIQVEAMPLNSSDLEDATIKVWDQYAPDRAGTWAKGSSVEGSQGRGTGETSGGIPMETTYQSRRELAAKQNEVGRNQAFELWRYNHAGRQLFPTIYSSQTLGLRFLFLDKNGTGRYRLESTNARRTE